MKWLAERKKDPQNDLLAFFCCLVLTLAFPIEGVWKRDCFRAPGDRVPVTLGRGFLHNVVATRQVTRG